MSNIIKGIKKEFKGGTIHTEVLYDREFTIDETPLSMANKLLNMTKEQRKEIFNYFCTNCGSSNKSCQCTNDE